MNVLRDVWYVLPWSYRLGLLGLVAAVVIVMYLAIHPRTGPSRLDAWLRRRHPRLLAWGERVDARMRK